MAKKKKKANKKQMLQKPKQQSNLPAILFFSISGVIIVAFLIFFAMNSSNSTDNIANEEPLEYEFSYEGQPSLGDENAPVKMVEIGDYKCSYCKDFHDDIFPNIKKDFIDTGKVQFFFIHFPFIDEDSVNIAKGAEAVFAQNKEAFWEYHDLVFQQEYDENEQWATVEALSELVEEHLPSLDAEKFRGDLENNAQIAAINEDLMMVNEAGVTSTPTIFINGKEFKKWHDYNALKEEIERLLESEAK